ncbi:DUF6753 family protein [Gloeothece verrucosa]|uniref:Uncharacterized protein n=1 Tax=Gloeothece verrucosa (strain PCC 7822) TaxID=497965 RepID=E0UMB1_GLOV7|nr:DUF6753 family protein [Gloeothece verrucosa]ADN18091.1 hypothetical protein Cyan7822_6291 [Gloeothece verrucosa PCC 7822]
MTATLTIEELTEEIKAYPEIQEIVDLALSDVDPKLAQQVFFYLIKTKVKPNDPLFVLMLTCRYYSLITLNAPNVIGNAFELGITKLLGALSEKLDRLQSISVTNVETQIALSVNKLLSRQDKATPRQKWIKRGKIAGLCMGLFSLGASLTYWWFEQSQLASLSANNRQLLAWAKSHEGQLARKIMQWNPSLIDGSCSDDVARLGIGWGEVLVKNGKIVGNKQATTGYCVVWRVPPNQRKFQ